MSKQERVGGKCRKPHPRKARNPLTLQQVRARLRRLGSKKKARILQGFFKTGPGEYGEGDTFLGVAVPCLRKLAGNCDGLSNRALLPLLRSPVHEERLLALLILVRRYRAGPGEQQQRVYELYMKHLRFVNNWDLVDLSAPAIVGAFLHGKRKEPLGRLARSESLWARRVAVVSTFYGIRHGNMSTTLRIAAVLLHDHEDLIHKAVGWMLREVGKRDLRAEEAFLKRHCQRMPRTMLRYAIERFPEGKRQRYLHGEFSVPSSPSSRRR